MHWKSFRYILYTLSRRRILISTGQRNKKLIEVQIQASVKNQVEVTSYVSARWSSLLGSVERILDLWPYLKMCIQGPESRLYSMIKDPETYLYTYSLNLLLHQDCPLKIKLHTKV